MGSARPAISSIGIANTLLNALEDMEILTFGDVFDYLLEDYTESEIFTNRSEIEIQISKINGRQIDLTT